MSKDNECQQCELSITPFKQISQEDINMLSEHMDVRNTCESCLTAALGEIEFPR